MDVIFEQPYCRIANVVEANIAKRQTASVYLGRLATSIGVLTPVQSGRDKLFIHRACASDAPQTATRDDVTRRIARDGRWQPLPEDG